MMQPGVSDVVQSTSKHNNSLMLPTKNTPSLTGQICSIKPVLRGSVF